jgi:hypothetical protein
MNKKNIPLIVGIAVPLLMIAFVAVSIYLPVFLTKPEYDFIYMSGGYGKDYYYEVSNGKIVRIAIPQPEAPPGVFREPNLSDPKIYHYDVSEDKSTELTFEQAQNYSLDTNHKSPDGFEVTSGNYSSGFPFFGGNYDYNTKYIRGHNSARKLNLTLDGGMYYDNFRLMGWVKK